MAETRRPAGPTPDGHPSDEAIRKAAEIAVLALRQIAESRANEIVAEEPVNKQQPADVPHPRTVHPQKLWTVRAVAEHLDVSPKYVYARIKAGDLPVVDLGTGYRAKLRVKNADVEAFISRRTY